MESWRELYPFRSHFFVIGDTRMHYVDESTDDGGDAVGEGERLGRRPLLMVHGNPTWSFYYRDLIKAFRGRYRAVAVDHIGCGLSDKPAGHTYDLSTRIDDLSQLVEALDLRDVTLIAHDWGGAIGLGTVLRMPERFSQIALFNTAAFPPPFVPRRIAACRIPLLGTLAVRGFNLFARAALWMAVEDRRHLPAAVRAGLLAPYNSWANRRAIDRFVKDIPRPGQPTWRQLEEIETGVTQLGLPALLLWGMKDWCFTPQCLDKLSEMMPHAQRHEFPEAGHYVVEEETATIVERLRDFLTGL